GEPMADTIKKVWDERSSGAAALGAVLHLGTAAGLAFGPLSLPAIWLPPLLLFPGYLKMDLLFRCPACNTCLGRNVGGYCPCCGVDLESDAPIPTNPSEGMRAAG